ncbi:orotate phosphoribosyltransferase [Calidithermus roseus]|uniref:Orotate phosphoribosyltransferase n=1 Tax=Calidithermus roseus TaxID=1644118 RepID=A0A399F0A5_9DEIN|nr:orotate phosphoribosyltransferase [Calidithermus roseus]RIH89245.1 Orotate phosphoribosyltransferase [Calidithermus roseus]
MDVLQMYRETGALHEGHFLLRSGRHSPMFLQSVTLMQHPLYAEAIGEAIGKLFEDVGLEFVIGPAMGGVTLAFVVARALGVRSLFAEKDGMGGMYVREGLTIRPGERFLAVEDVITTGGSVQRAIRAAEAKGGVCVGVGAIVDRSGGKADFGVPFRALTALEFPTYDPSDCPLCRQGVPLREI